MQIIHPLKDDRFQISSPYGHRFHPITKEKSFHAGVDYRAPEDTPVYSVVTPYKHEVKFQAGGAGIYIKQWYKTPQGNEVIIYYMHLSKGIEFKENKSFPIIGDLIGFTGTTGQSTGPHLHFGIKIKFAGNSDYLSAEPTQFINKEPMVGA